MNATPISTYYFSTILSLTSYTLLQDEHMYDIQKTLHGIKKVEVLIFRELSMKCSL